MEAPAVSASSPLSGVSAHQHSSVVGDDEDGVNSKLVIDLEGYTDRGNAYSPSEYYCYSLCDATGKRPEGTVNTVATVATTSCGGSTCAGHSGVSESSLSASIESVVSAAAAFASSSSSAAGVNGDKDFIAGGQSNSALRTDCGRSRALHSTARCGHSSLHDLNRPRDKSPATAPGGAPIGRPCSKATTSPASALSASVECSSSDSPASARVSTGVCQIPRVRQQNNRNATSAGAVENTCTSNAGGYVLSSPTCATLSGPAIGTNSKAPSAIGVNSPSAIPNKTRRSGASSSAKRSKTTNPNNIGEQSSTSVSADVTTPAIGKRGPGDGLLNASNVMATNASAAVRVASPPPTDQQQNISTNQQNGSTNHAQRQQSSSTSKPAASLIRPSSLFTPQKAASPSASNPSTATEDDSANNPTDAAGLKMKIKRKKMATRQTAASHEVISDTERRRQHSEEASSLSSSSSACASPAVASSARNSPSRKLDSEKKRKHSSSSAGSVRPATTSAGATASSPTTCFTSVASSFPSQHQLLPASPSFTSLSRTASSPQSAIANRASPFMSAISNNTHGLDTINSSTASNVDTISIPVNISVGLGNGNSKAVKAATQQEEKMGAPPKKKSKLQNNQEVTGLKTGGGREQVKIENEQGPKEEEGDTVFTSDLDKAKEDVEHHDVGTWVRTVGTTTETECLGPCEPGTAVTLEGIVWQETAGGILVINVTWRGKTYVGTLLDCTKYDWAPPRHCDSPHSENDSLANGAFGVSSNSNSSGGRTPAKSGNGGSGNGSGRGRKGGGSKRQHQLQQPQQLSTQASESASSSNTSVVSSDQETANGSDAASAQNGIPSSSCSQSRNVVSEAVLEPHSPVMFECPLGGCEKKYPALIGVKYHQSSAHPREKSSTQKKAQQGCSRQNSEQNAKSSNEGADQPSSVPEETTETALETAETTTKLSPEERASLESLFKVAEQNRQQWNQQPQQETSTRAGSPAYSDISEDEEAPSTLKERPPPAVSTATVMHHGHGVEKPTAIVEPQPLASAVLAMTTPEAPVEASSSQPSADPISAACSSSIALQHTPPKVHKRGHYAKAPKESKQKEKPMPVAMMETSDMRATPPTSASSVVPISPAVTRSPDTAPATAVRALPVVKLEPGSPRPLSLTQGFATPGAPPPPILQPQQLMPTPVHSAPHPAAPSHSSASMARSPTPSHLALPSPAPVLQLGPSPHPCVSAPPVPPTPPHAHMTMMNQMNQMNHPAFMFNPFNGGAMYPVSLPPGMMPQSVGLDHTMAAAAAALMASGHPAAAMYAPPGSMAAAALAAAGFQMSLSGSPAVSHPSVGYGFGPPPPSMAVSMSPGVFQPSFCSGTNMPGPMVSMAHPLPPAPVSPAGPMQTLQQPAQQHKIHELAEHGKRSAPVDPVPPTSIATSSAGPNILNGPVPQKQSPLSSNLAPGADSIPAAAGVKQRVPSSAKSIPTGPSTGQSGTGGHNKPGATVRSSGDDGHSRQQTPVSTANSNSTASMDLNGPQPPLSSSSPPVQRHLHTHHHTHTYPTLLAPAIDSSYAALMASQQAAAAAAGVVGNFPPFRPPQKP